MFRKILMFSVLLFGLSLLVSPVFAVGTSASVTASAKASAKATEVAAKIACVGKAVAVRESTLSTAFSAHSQSMSAAYATRANELAGAYSNTTTASVQAGVKVSWADFKKTTQSANAKWKGDKSAAWTVFKNSVSACKAPSGVSDSANSSAEPKGE